MRLLSINDDYSSNLNTTFFILVTLKLNKIQIWDSKLTKNELLKVSSESEY